MLLNFKLNILNYKKKTNIIFSLTSKQQKNTNYLNNSMLKDPYKYTEYRN